MAGFSVETLSEATRATGLRVPAFVIEQLVAAVDAGKHVILTGPPGTGKTSLAFLAAEVGQSSLMCTGYLPTTATTEWTTFETIGGFQPTVEGLIFRAGMFVEALESGRWLVIDELNRANFDRAFGQLFTVLSGQPVVLPFRRQGRTQNISLVPFGVPTPFETDPIRVPSTWRIIATMNMFDKNLLFEMSFALMRRFVFIEVPSPDEEDFRELLAGPGEEIADLLSLRQLRDLGPAIFLDAAAYAAQRSKSVPSRSRLLYEVFYGYLLPQFEGVDDAKAAQLYAVMRGVLEPAEQELTRNMIEDVLGVDLPV